MSSKQVFVNFQGDKSVSGSDFRASIVTKTKDGKTRYSTMWNDGANTLNLQGDEEKAYLVVCATPDKMLDLTSFDVNVVGTKYPYKVQVSTSDKTDEKVNIASKAVGSTSYCSEWENINALNDGFDPINSMIDHILFMETGLKLEHNGFNTILIKITQYLKVMYIGLKITEE